MPPYSKSYDIYIPYIKLSDFKQKYFKSKIKNIYRIHIVSSGESLSYIGKSYGVPYKMIMDFNNLKSTRLKLKQKLIIPIDDKLKPKKRNNKFYYLVKRGDTLESISKTHRISVKNLRLKNRIKGSLIKAGERLKIQ